MLGKPHLVQTGMHAVQMFASYCLMLIFMTFNVYLCLSVVLGFATGYFLVGWKRVKPPANLGDHCN